MLIDANWHGAFVALYLRWLRRGGLGFLWLWSCALENGSLCDSLDHEMNDKIFKYSLASTHYKGSCLGGKPQNYKMEFGSDGICQFEA